MRLFNISSLENASERFVEATQMLRAVANSPQRLVRHILLDDRQDSFGLPCDPFYGLTGTMTSDLSMTVYSPNTKVKPGGTIGAHISGPRISDSVTWSKAGSTNPQGISGFASLGSQGQRDF